MSNNHSQEPSKNEVQTTKLNKMPGTDKHSAEIAEEVAEDAREVFSKLDVKDK